MVNPAPGTVVDTSLVEHQYSDDFFDFYLIPHKATIATALPVHFKVVYNTTKYDQKQIQEYTYHQCYNYFNFMGSIKVPASVMYAHKLATHKEKLKKLDNHVRLNDTLYYL